MKKTLAKIIIVLGLAGVIGRGLVTYTTRGADMYITIQQDMRATMLQLLNAKDDTSALDPYLQTPAEQLSGLYNPGIVATSGSVDAGVLQERLQHYSSQKDMLWND